ncbi:MAG: CARDB domain-containing protein [Bacteroidota bacterium]|nr:CARDB domain-containing protein [Bacteroidota bacterium]
MKKNFLFLIATLLCVAVFAQTPKLPTGQPGKPQLPAPKIPALKPADLVVTGIQLLIAEKNNTTKSVSVKVKVTVKNNGQLDAGATKLSGAFQKTTAQGVSWTEVSQLADFPAIKAGQSVTRDCSFTIPIGLINDNRSVNSFNFRVKADVMDAVKESDENNNFSQGILIGL